MGAHPYWIDRGQEADGTAWNSVILGSSFLPGIAVVTCSVARDVDAKKTKGQDGATLEDNGVEPAEIGIELTLPRRDDWELWQQVLPDIHPRRPGGPRTPLEIVHPAPNMLGIRNIYVKEIIPEPPTAKGGMKVTLRCVEWFPAPKPVKAAAGKAGTKGAKSKPAKRSTADATRRLESLRAEELAYEPTGIDALERAFGETDPGGAGGGAG